jgi:hypothetical protein
MSFIHWGPRRGSRPPRGNPPGKISGGNHLVCAAHPEEVRDPVMNAIFTAVTENRPDGFARLDQGRDVRNRFNIENGLLNRRLAI